MLLLAILLLLAAVGLLVAAVVTSQLGLAWVSVGVSALAAMAVLLWRRRARRRRTSTADDESALAGQDAQPPAAVSSPAERPADPVLGPGLGSNEVAPADSENDGTADPAEEHTEAADLLVVSDSSDEVLVVDEQPRYHLARCRWPDPSKSERLPVREARDLGFTPCDHCRPDAEIAHRHREATPGAAHEQPSSGARSV